MQEPNQADYFHRRAEEERAAADCAADDRAAQTHRALAARYEAISRGSPVHEADDDDRLSPGILPKEFRILP